MSQCLECKNEIIGKKTKRFCSAKCRLLAFRKGSVSVSESVSNQLVSVSNETVTPKDETVTETASKTPTTAEELHYTHTIPSEGTECIPTGYCQSCGRKITDIPNQWVDPSNPNEEIAGLICKCIDCVKK